MHHRYTWTIGTGLGIGGIGFIGRVIIALAIIFFLRYYDKQNPEYTKGIKIILAGVAVAALLGIFALGIFVSMAVFPFVINW